MLDLHVVGDGAGASRMLAMRGSKMVSHDYAPGIRLGVFHKDLDLIAAFAAAHGSHTPLLEASSRLYAAAVAAGGGEMDSSVVIEVFERIRRGEFSGP